MQAMGCFVLGLGLPLPRELPLLMKRLLLRLPPVRNPAPKDKLLLLLPKPVRVAPLPNERSRTQPQPAQSIRSCMSLGGASSNSSNPSPMTHSLPAYPPIPKPSRAGLTGIGTRFLKGIEHCAMQSSRA